MIQLEKKIDSVCLRPQQGVCGTHPRGGGGRSAGFCITLLGRHCDNLTLCSTHIFSCEITKGYAHFVTVN